MTDKHFHTRQSELAVFWIPCNPDIPMEIKVVDNNWQALSKLVSGYLEVVRSAVTPEMYCGCPTVLVANEEGNLSGLMVNTRVMGMSPVMLRGDLFLIGEGTLKGEDEDDDSVDFISLPQAFNRWKGPGCPVPSVKKRPWEAEVGPSWT